MLEIIPSILTDDLSEFGEVLDRLNDVSLPNFYPLTRVQIDINDGTFLDVKTVEPQTLFEFTSDLKFDYHLMVTDPTLWVRRCVSADRIIGQIEYMASQSDFIGQLKEWGLKTGLAVDFDTDVENIDSEILPELDVVLLMSYPAGMGGQDFNEMTFDKITKLKNIKLSRDCKFKICLDGGITLDNIKRAKGSGIDEVVVGRKLTEGDIEENLEKFYKATY
ncbi:MAG: Ribulose-phosphate 3-epimerase [Candidatus Curtissbacteria bacterium GW2011_GWA1_40_16]|uniref:Ribulose-phosphate 3-epimerase n=1 Tax=Candidatus Curtissbacteria bacterium GW2011_GWA1_40_16 TaxID=1618405 RepID=A0A0G0UI62_9BACT|nr:MAG: Ribulose-phosphate 3-epimerase [Candidatus Curtissbacteria bacterium GW2011_GWA1_40_16]